MAFRNFNQNAIPTPSHSGTKKKRGIVISFHLFILIVIMFSITL